MKKKVIYKNKTWTKQSVRESLERSDKSVISGLMLIYSHQTRDEQAAKTTKYTNGIGFNGCDSEFLSSLASQYARKGYLTDKQLLLARKTILKYAGQMYAVIQHMAEVEALKKEGVMS